LREYSFKNLGRGEKKGLRDLVGFSSSTEIFFLSFFLCAGKKCSWKFGPMDQDGNAAKKFNKKLEK